MNQLAFDSQNNTFSVPGRSTTVFVGFSKPTVIEQESSIQKEDNPEIEQTPVDDSQPIDTDISSEITEPTLPEQRMIRKKTYEIKQWFQLGLVCGGWLTFFGWDRSLCIHKKKNEIMAHHFLTVYLVLFRGT